MHLVQVKHRPLRLKGDGRIGAPAPAAASPGVVRVLCAYRYWQSRSGSVHEREGIVLVVVRSAVAIRAAFTDAMSVVLADWNETYQGPRPRSYALSWYLPENGKRTFP